MMLVQSLAFAGRDIPIHSGEIEGDPAGPWRLVAWADETLTTLPADGWLTAGTAAGPIVAWGTLTEARVAEAKASGRCRLTFVDALAPEDQAIRSVLREDEIEGGD